MNLSFRTQILACLDCDLNDSKSIDAISSDDVRIVSQFSRGRYVINILVKAILVSTPAS